MCLKIRIKERMTPRNSTLREPKTDHRLLPTQPRPRLIPTQFLDSFPHDPLVSTIDFQTLVPLSTSSREDLEAIVLLFVFVSATVALE